MKENNMAIYSGWGSRIEILAYCGKHKPKGYAVPLVLVFANRTDPDRPELPAEKHYYLASSLRADGGYAEIEAAVAAAPVVELPLSELEKALGQAA
jgi:hypothetical protein